MALGIPDSVGVHRYRFNIDGKTSTNIKSITGLSVKLDPIITKTLDMAGKPLYNVFAGNKQFVGTCTVTRLLTDNQDWYNWFEATLNNITSARTSCMVEVLDPRMDDGTCIRRYTFESCMPNELKISDMNATQAQAVDEILTFHYTNIVATPG